MTYKISYRFRTLLFALIMSASTALILSGIIIYLRMQPPDFIQVWLGAFIIAWPMCLLLF